MSDEKNTQLNTVAAAQNNAQNNAKNNVPTLLSRITAYLCLGSLFLALILIVLRIVIKNVVYEKMGIYNSFVAFMLDGDNDVENENSSKPVNIDWASIYPYATEDIYVPSNQNSSVIDRYNNLVSKVKNQMEWYATDGLPSQTKLTELAIAAEGLAGWKVQEQDYDAVITLRNKHLTCVCRSEDVTEQTGSTVRFNQFLQERGINLMYVMVPFKIGTDSSVLPLGITDNSNDNADRLLANLKAAGIDCLDLRELEADTFADHYDMFYYTDHHWNATAAIWACDQVAKQLHELYGYDYDSELFNINNYTREIYKDVFLGSYGRRVTLSKADPEDFEILYPNKDMTFTLTMPEKDKVVTGGFDEVFIDHSFLEITNYYEMDAYSSYVTLRKYVAKIENKDAANPDKKILILRDSFGNNFGPYFAQQYGTVELLDVSSFTGSIKRYIEESKPDTVILLYNPTMIEPIDWSSYTSSKFDFR